VQPPQYLGPDSAIERSIVGEGCEIEGKVYNSVIGPGVKIGKDTVVSHSIIMNDTQIGEGCNIEKAIIAEKAQIGSGVTLGAFEQKENETKPGIYCEGLVTIGERSVIPDNVKVGKNTMIAGITTAEDYADGILDSGRTLDKAGD
jgi:glucose-1-phosphate adenylyltransferase